MRFVLIHILLACTLGLKGQISLAAGSEFTSPATCEGDFATRDKEGNLYLLNDIQHPENGKFFLYKFNHEKSQLIYQKEIWFMQKGEFQFVTATCYNGYLEIYFHLSDKLQQTDALIKRSFLLSSGEENVNPTEIDRFPAGFESDVKKEFHILFSPDKTLSCILREEASSSRQRLLHVKLIDHSSGKMQSEQVLNTNSDNEVPAGHGYTLDMNGNLFYKFETIDQHKHGIQKIGKAIKENHQILLPCNGISLINPNLEILEDELLCTGEMLKGERAQKTFEEDVEMGFFLFRIEGNTMKIIKEHYDYLPPNIQEKLNYHDKNYFYKLEGIRSFHYSHKIYQHYGTLRNRDELYVIKFIGFKYEVEKMNGEEMNYYFEREILVLKYKNDGLEWMQCIPRRVDHAEKLGLSCRMTQNALSLYFFNHEKNAGLLNNPIYKASQVKKLTKDPSPLYQVEILTNGQMKQINLGNIKHLSFVNVNDSDHPTTHLRLNSKRSTLYAIK